METLYRKYRSQSFAQLVGQEQVVQILRNSIRRGRLSHAYLFSGPRGTGKTSVARIFAKALCCLNPQDGDCCAECANCLSIANGTALDVQEIDAASKNKVDDIRELRDRVGYAPAIFPYKIYIIDEVHMVTPAGFNALLKTLEEPPTHVKFLLCTTEPHKLPLTILSRCLRLDFTRIALPLLAAHLQWMAGQEGFALAEDAALELAELAEGSARDAISLLDQLVVYCEVSITREDVRNLFQLGDPSVVPDVADAISASNKRALLDVWERLANQGADAGRFLLQIADELKRRYLDTGNTAWGRALEAIWEGLNLLKQESFPGLLVELSLLQAAEAFNNPAAQVPLIGTPIGSSSGAAVDPSAQAVTHKPDFLKDRSSTATLAIQPARHVAPTSKPVIATTSPTVVSPAEALPAPNPKLMRPTTDPKWESFLAALKDLSLTAYALIYQHAHPNAVNGKLELVYESGEPWASQTCAFAQFPENMDTYGPLAQQVYGVDSMALGMAGDETHWKLWPEAKREEPAPPVNTNEIPKPRADHSVGQAIFTDDDPQPELAVEDLFLAAAEGEVGLIPDPTGLAESAAQLGTQLDTAARSSPPTIAEAIEIFEAIVLPDED
jgi:DNA polymerase III subunit gamma/tau